MTVSLSTERPVEFDQMATRDWVQVARSFASSIEAARERIEQQRRVPSDLIRAMADAGLLRLATPRVHGGEETSLITLARTIEELSRADGSVGWTVLIGSNDGYHAGYLPEASAAEIFGADASVIVAGSGFARHAVAKPVRGGYQLTGRWGLASGCQEASWFAAAAPILRDSDARPQLGANGAADVQLFFVPKAACTIILGRAETKSAHACQDGERDIVVEAAHTGHAWLGRAPGAYRLGGLDGVQWNGQHDRLRQSQAPPGGLPAWRLPFAPRACVRPHRPPPTCGSACARPRPQ